MTSEFEFTVAPKVLNLAPGDTAEAVVTLHNRGQSVDQLTLSIEGLDPSWYTLPVSSVALFPNDQDTLKIILHPPKIADTKAGSCAFRLKVISRENPEEIATVELATQIRVLPELELSISPQRVAGRKAAYRIIVNNMGDSETPVTFRASDTHRRLRYDLQPQSLTVPGGGSAEVPLQVRRGWLVFFGGEKEFDFQVKVMPEGGLAEQARTINGQFVGTPWYKTLSKVRLPWLARPPAIVAFRATTEDKREFKLGWSVKRATEVKLDDESVASKGERWLRPPEATRYVLTASNKYGSSSQTVEVTPLPLPKAKASERIRVSLSPMELQVQAGGAPVQATLEVQNLGEIVDKFLVEVKGLGDSWYTRSASSVALMPRATAQVQICLNPPKKKGVRSGLYPFTVTVCSESNPEEATTVAAELEVPPALEFKLTVRPYRVFCRRKGNFHVILANTGVTDAFPFLDASDLDAGVKFRFKNDYPSLIAWKTIEVPLVARPKRGYIKGEQKRYDIRIQATTADGNTQSTNAELYQSPFIGSWRPVLSLVGVLLVLGIIAVVGNFLVHLGGGFDTHTGGPQAWFYRLVRTVQGWSLR